MEDDYYKILGIEKNATESEVKKAYYKKAKLFHPDRHRNSNNTTEVEEKFKQVSEAYEVLSNVDKRQLYDQYGKAGLDQSHQAGFNPFDHLSSMFNMQRQSRPQKTEDIHLSLNVTLKELYDGCTKSVTYKRLVKCIKCQARGTTKDMDTTCKTCQGRGQIMQKQQQGFMIVQNIIACPHCQGTGDTIKPKDCCQACKGKKYKPQEETWQVDVEPGMMDHHAITRYGGADEHVKLSPGDVIVILNCLKHDLYQRIGNDLVFQLTITLYQAVSGKGIELIHLNGDCLNLQYPNVIQSHTIKKLSGYGMTILNQPDCFGDLYIQFELVIDLTPCQRQKVIELLTLAQPLELITPDTARKPANNTLMLEHVDTLPSTPSQGSYHSDDDGFTTQTQCAQQ